MPFELFGNVLEQEILGEVLPQAASAGVEELNLADALVVPVSLHGVVEEVEIGIATISW